MLEIHEDVHVSFTLSEQSLPLNLASALPLLPRLSHLPPSLSEVVSRSFLSLWNHLNLDWIDVETPQPQLLDSCGRSSVVPKKERNEIKKNTGPLQPLTIHTRLFLCDIMSLINDQHCCCVTVQAQIALMFGGSEWCKKTSPQICQTKSNELVLKLQEEKSTDVFLKI